MLEDFVSDSAALSRIRKSVLHESLEHFVRYLLARGHTARMVKEYSRVAVHFVYWYESVDGSLPIDDEEIAHRFYAEHLAQCHCAITTSNRPRVRAGLVLLMQILRSDGHLASQTQKPKTAIDVLVDEYERHLKSACGASSSTRRQYTRYVRDFLAALYGKRPLDMTRLSARDIIEFVSARATNHICTTATNKAIITSLRSFLRYAAYRGFCDTRLSHAVPAVARWRLAGLPSNLSKQQLAAFLGAFDQSTPIGRRDYAIALSLVRLGLRAGEVAALCVDDIDWRKGILRVHHGKGQRMNTLPLCADIGRAIAEYIRHDRPPTQQRNVFLRHSPCVGDAIKSCTVQAIVKRAFKRSGVTMAATGSHILRHTAATLMIQSGVSIKEVADILGHRSINTTCIYAKVDLPALASVVLPWPEVL